MADTVHERRDAARVTIGIPTCNRVALLQEAIDSVRAQTIAEWELFVFDDGASDEAARLVAGYADERITYVRNERQLGPLANVSQVLSAGTAPFLAILLDDDVMFPEHLQRTCTLLEAYPRAAVAHSAFELWTRGGQVRPVTLAGVERPFEESGRDFVRRATLDPPRVWLGTALMRRCAVEHLRFDPAALPVADVMFWLRAAQHGTVVYEPVPTTCYRISEGFLPQRELSLTEALDEDGGYRPTFTTVEAFRRGFGRFRQEVRMPWRERAVLRLAEARTVHGMLQSVVRRRWASEPTRAERLAVLREALRIDRTLALDPAAWVKLAGPALRAARTAERRPDDAFLDRRAQLQAEELTVGADAVAPVAAPDGDASMPAARTA